MASRAITSRAARATSPVAPGGNGTFTREAAGAGTPDLVGPPGARIQRVLVGRDVEDVRIVPEDLLGPVAVVHVPVDDQHALAEGGTRGRRDGHVVEEAEPHGAVGRRVVPRGADRDEGRRPRPAARAPPGRPPRLRRRAGPPSTSRAGRRCRGRCPRRPGRRMPPARPGRTARGPGTARRARPHEGAAVTISSSSRERVARRPSRRGAATAARGGAGPRRARATPEGPARTSVVTPAPSSRLTVRPEAHGTRDARRVAVPVRWPAWPDACRHGWSTARVPSTAARCARVERTSPSPRPDRSGCACASAASAAPTSTWPRATSRRATPGSPRATRSWARSTGSATAAAAGGRATGSACPGSPTPAASAASAPRAARTSASTRASRAGTSTGATPSTPWSTRPTPTRCPRPSTTRRPHRCSAPASSATGPSCGPTSPHGGRLGIYGFGGSAHLTAQIALARGARVHVMTRSPDARELALELGAASVGGGRRGPARAARRRHPLRAGRHAGAPRPGRPRPGRHAGHRRHLPQRRSRPSTTRRTSSRSGRCRA